MKVASALIFISLGLILCPCAYARDAMPFEGMVDLQNKRVSLQFGNGTENAVALDLHRSSADSMSFSLDLRHVRMPFCDLATVLQGEIKFITPSNAGREASGEIRSRYTLLNHKPVQDWYLKFALRDRKLIIDRFWAGALTGSGQIELSGEHRSDLNFELVSSDLEMVGALFQTGSVIQPPAVSGTLTGVIALTGPLFKPLVKGHLAAYNGCFKALCYESILLQLEGTFPSIRLDDSVVTHADGFSFNIAGGVNLSDWARLPYQVRQLRKIPIVAATRDKREWILKRQRSRVNKDSVTELKYQWLKDDRGDAEGVLGFEQKIGF